ncbi:MAG: hypothetical protein ACLQGP_02185, partial [Isosphaeraceae bacterium]
MNVFGDDPAPNGSGGSPFRFPELPIINPGVPTPPPASTRSQREKYGGLFYLGIAGLLFLIALVGWFGYGIWSNRDIWMDVYAVHDTSRPEVDRIEAAFRLSGNPQFSDVQKLDISLRRDPPELERIGRFGNMNKRNQPYGRPALQALRAIVILLAMLAAGQVRAAWPEHTITL